MLLYRLSTTECDVLFIGINHGAKRSVSLLQELDFIVNTVAISKQRLIAQTSSSTVVVLLTWHN